LGFSRFSIISQLLTPWAIGFRPDGLTYLDFHFYVAHPLRCAPYWEQIAPRSEAVALDAHNVESVLTERQALILTGNFDYPPNRDAVEDAVVEVARAKVAIVPLRAGSGTRFKILKAWASLIEAGL
jgi:hypothetical protein